MISSMTGFARREIQIPEGNLQWEIRTVNHRYLDIQLKLPDGFRALEPALRQVASGKIRRGKLDASLQFGRRPGEGTETELNLDQARVVIGHLQTLAGEMQNAADVSPMTILRWPGILTQRESDPTAVFAAAQDAFSGAIDELAEHRDREGAQIQDMLERRCVDVEACIAAVKQRLPEVLVQIRNRFAERIAALDVEPNTERLEQELAIIVQKLDVSEELDRMQAHVDEVRNNFASGEPVGRRLDFLMQELNREANTLGSKSADSATTQQSVELKVLIEQMREQIQNVE
jgi:uncharacterized protein (TIGR00255 family)